MISLRCRLLFFCVLPVFLSGMLNARGFLPESHGSSAVSDTAAGLAYSKKMAAIVARYPDSRVLHDYGNVVILGLCGNRLEAVVDFYRKKFQAAGWKKDNEGFMGRNYALGFSRNSTNFGVSVYVLNNFTRIQLVLKNK